MTSITDYLGRTVDLLAFQGQQPAGVVLLTASLAQEGQGGEICTGVQKLMQRWLLEFLTEQGSMTYLTARGCGFMAALRAGQLRTLVDVEQAFFLSAKQIESNLRAEETPALPPDEAYGGVDLNSVTLDSDRVAMNITLLSLAGTSRKVILPINVRTG